MDRDILIIGAGPSGLDSAAEFTRAGLDHDHVEHHSGVGGLWGIDNPTTPMYESALFISSKRLSCFPGRPFSDDVADHPPRAEVLRYLREFAADEGIAARIRFGVEVIAVEEDRENGGDGGYRVTMLAAGDDGGAAGEPETRRYRDVICASGTLSTRNLPDIPGEFAGEYRHSATYRGIDELRSCPPGSCSSALRPFCACTSATCASWACRSRITASSRRTHCSTTS